MSVGPLFPKGEPFPFAYLVGPCEARQCKGRLIAMQVGAFVYSHDAPKGWIFVEGAAREWLGQAKWSAVVYGTPDHTGEPFTWSTCPWCGRDLDG